MSEPNEAVFHHYRNLVAQNEEVHQDVDELVDRFLYIFYRLGVNQARGISPDKMAEVAIEIVKMHYSEI